MRVGDEQAVDEVLVLHRGRLLAAPSTALGAVVGERLTLEVAGVRQGHDHVFGRDQVLDVDLGGVHHQLGATRVAELVTHRAELVDDDRGDALGAGEDVEQVGDDVHHLAVFADDLVLLEAGQALQAKLEDRLGLGLGQTIALRLQAVLRVQPFRPVAVGERARQHLLDQRRAPLARHQLALGICRRGRGLDQRDDLVDVGQRHRQAFEDVAAVARLLQLEDGAAGDDLAAVLEEAHQHLLEVEQARLAVDQRHHVHAEAVLQLGVLEQLVEHHLGHLAALELDDQAHAGLVGLVADLADALDLLLVDQLGHALLQGALVHLVGQLVDDDGLAVGLADRLEVGARAHDHASAAGAVALAHAMQAVDQRGGREVRRLHDVDQGLDVGFGVFEQLQAGVDDFAEVVRRDVGRHADRDAARAVDQQVRDARRHHQRLFLGAVVVGAEVDRFLVDVGQQLVADARHADFGVTHRRRVVAVDRAEVALAIDQHVAQREVLRHAHDGVVHRDVAVRVVLADDVADDTRRLLVGTIPVVGQLVHREQHAPVHRLEAVARIGERAAHDHAHRVIEVGVPHLLFEADRQGFLGELGHA